MVDRVQGRDVPEGKNGEFLSNEVPGCDAYGATLMFVEVLDIACSKALNEHAPHGLVVAGQLASFEYRARDL